MLTDETILPKLSVTEWTFIPLLNVRFLLVNIYSKVSINEYIKILSFFINETILGKSINLQNHSILT